MLCIRDYEIHGGGEATALDGGSEIGTESRSGSGIDVGDKGVRGGLLLCVEVAEVARSFREGGKMKSGRFESY